MSYVIAKTTATGSKLYLRTVARYYPQRRIQYVAAKWTDDAAQAKTWASEETATRHLPDGGEGGTVEPVRQ